MRREAVDRLEWLLPWLASALATFDLVLVRPSLVPASCAVALLARAALRREPVALRRFAPWLLLLPFVLWWTVLGVAGNPRPDELLAVAAWYLLLLSLMQGLGGMRAGGWRTWNVFSAVLLVGFRPNVVQAALMTALVLLVLLQSRLDARRIGASGGRLAWAGALLPVLALALLAQRFDVSIPLRGFDRWTPPESRKGFSSSLRLGSGFGLEPDPSDDEVVLRAWSDRPVQYMKGAVFDVYRHGTWLRTETWTNPVSSRNRLEFSVFCQESDTMAQPLGWAHASSSTAGYLLVPPEAGCVGAVADTLDRTGSGIWHLRGEGFSRGWMWFPGAVSQRVITSERSIPEPLAGALDSAFAATGAGGASPGLALARIGSWMDAHFQYRLQLRDAGKQDPLRIFLRDREGYCEHFATLGALLARRAGIPSRVVTGYAFPEREAGAWLFRRSNAHAWVEVFLLGRGWTTWDPTPAAVSVPSRRVFFHRWSEAFFTRIAAAWHVVRDGAWREAMTERFDRLSQATQSAWKWLATGAVLMLALVAGFLRWHRRKPKEPDDASHWREGLARAEARLRREGFVREPGETVGAFLARIPDSAHGPSHAFLEVYQRERWASSAEGRREKP